MTQTPNTRSGRRRGWVGPDGITYASESDYADSWGALAAACERLQAHTQDTAAKVAQAMRGGERSVAWVADRTGMSRTTLRRKLGGGVDFTVSELGRIAGALGVHPYELLPDGSHTVRVVLRPGVLERAQQVVGLEADPALAGALGVGQDELRAVRGGGSPSVAFVAGLARLLGLGLAEVATMIPDADQVPATDQVPAADRPEDGPVRPRTPARILGGAAVEEAAR